jgi:hypothetical protein
LLLSIDILTLPLPVMIEHVVMVKMKEDLSPTEEQALKEAAMGLTSIPGTISVTFGRNYTARGQGFTHCKQALATLVATQINANTNTTPTPGFICRFPDKATEGAYQTHPDHVAFRDEHLKPLLSKEPVGPLVLVIDYGQYSRARSTFLALDYRAHTVICTCTHAPHCTVEC